MGPEQMEKCDKDSSSTVQQRFSNRDVGLTRGIQTALGRLYNITVFPDILKAQDVPKMKNFNQYLVTPMPMKSRMRFRIPQNFGAKEHCSIPLNN